MFNSIKIHNKLLNGAMKMKIGLKNTLKTNNFC